MTPCAMRVVAVATSAAKGTPKGPVARGRLVRGHGIEGDAHAGPGPRQVSLLSLPSIRAMEARFGAPLGFGRFGENVVVDGELAGTAGGDLLAIGNRAVLEVTAIGKVCHTGCAIREVTGDCIMPREGVFARVVLGGEVAPGDVMRSIRPVADVTVATIDPANEGAVAAALRACRTRLMVAAAPGAMEAVPDLAKVLAARCDGAGLAASWGGRTIAVCYDLASPAPPEGAFAPGTTPEARALEGLDELAIFELEAPCGT